MAAARGRSAMAKDGGKVSLDVGGTADAARALPHHPRRRSERAVAHHQYRRGSGPGGGDGHRRAGHAGAGRGKGLQDRAAELHACRRSDRPQGGQAEHPHGGGAARSPKRSRNSAAWSLADYLPAGFEIDNPHLVSSGDTGTLEWITDAAEPVNTEFRDDRFTAAFERKADDAPVFTVAYVVRAVAPGKYVRPQAVVEDMYRPDRYGRTGDRKRGSDRGEMSASSDAGHSAHSRESGNPDAEWIGTVANWVPAFAGTSGQKISLPLASYFARRQRILPHRSRRRRLVDRVAWPSAARQRRRLLDPRRRSRRPLAARLRDRRGPLALAGARRRRRSALLRHAVCL